MAPVGSLCTCRAQLSGCSYTPQVAQSRTARSLSAQLSHTCGLHRVASLGNSRVSSVAGCEGSTSISSLDADHPISNRVAAPSTSIALRQRMQQMFDGTAKPHQQWRQQQLDGTADDAAHDSAAAAAAAAGMPSAGSKVRSKGGFGAPGSSSSKTSKKQKAGSQQQAAALSPEAACPCQSGLQYKACCQPFLSGACYPGSAYELVRARLTAMKTGNSAFLAASIHPDCSLALGGPRDMARRVKQQCAMFKRAKCEVVGMAHCPGDTDGSWFVLAILEGTAGEFKGVKVPHMEMVARSSWKEPPKGGTGSSSGGSWSFGQQQEWRAHSSSSGDSASDRWLFYKQTNQIPTNGESEAIYRLLAQHVPEMLLDENGQPGQGVAWRPVYFNWVTPNLRPSSSSSSSSSGNDNSSSTGSDSSSSSSSRGGWYLDLLAPAAQPLSSRRGGGSSGSASEVQQRVALVPRGVFVMDDYLEQRKARQ